MLTLHGIQMQDVWPPVARLKIKPRVTHNDETPMQGIMNGDQKEILAEDVHPLHINITKHVIIMTLRPLAHWLSSSISTAVSVQHETAINIQKQTGQKRLTLVQDLTRKWFLSAGVRALIASLSGVPSRPAHTRDQRAGLTSHHLLLGKFHHLLLKVVTIKHVSQPGDQQGERVRRKHWLTCIAWEILLDSRLLCQLLKEEGIEEVILELTLFVKILLYPPARNTWLAPAFVEKPRSCCRSRLLL